VAVDLAVGAREWQALCVRDSVFSCGPWLAPMDGSDLERDQSRQSADQVRGVARAAALRPSTDGDALGAFGWLSNMGVVLLEGGGSLCYSPVLHPDGPEALVAALRQIGALPVRAQPSSAPATYSARAVLTSRMWLHVVLRVDGCVQVRVVVAPSPAHHMALAAFQPLFPDAAYICGAGSPQRPGLRIKVRTRPAQCPGS
jgi:hypothetical protein